MIIRFFNVFGPRRLGENAMGIFIRAAQENKDIVIKQDGTQIRAWCYIDDFCEGLYRTLVEDVAIGNAYNIGNHNNTLTINELARAIKKILNSKSKIVHEDINYSDIDIRIPDTGKAFKDLKFCPKYNMEESIIKTADWHSKVRS